MGPEFKSGWEYAAPERVGAYCEALQHWLEDNGEFIVEPGDTIYGSVDGLPIAEDGPYFIFEAHKQALEILVPHAFAALEVGSQVAFIYRTAFYVPSENGILTFQAPSIEVYVDKPDDHELESEGLAWDHVTGANGTFWKCHRSPLPRDLFSWGTNSEADARLMRAIDGIGMADCLGLLEEVTNSELDTLFAITAMLDHIKHHQESSNIPRQDTGS